MHIKLCLYVDPILQVNINYVNYYFLIRLVFIDICFSTLLPLRNNLS